MNDKILMADNGLINFTNAIAIKEIVKFKRYNEEKEFEYPTEYTEIYPYKLKHGESFKGYGIEFIFDNNRVETITFDTESEMLLNFKTIKKTYESEYFNAGVIHNEN